MEEGRVLLVWKEKVVSGAPTTFMTVQVTVKISLASRHHDNGTGMEVGNVSSTP